MRILAVILSVYFFALNFVSCEDAYTNIDDIQAEISQNLDIENSHDGSDQCSPFCQCHCCHVHIIGFDILQFETRATYISTQIFSQNEGISKDIARSILQPPQLID